MSKMFSRLFSLYLLVFYTATVVCAQDSFRSIVPFVTTRVEVEKKIGKPNEYGRYELDEGRVYILYRETECETLDNSCFCLVPIGTVLQVEVQPYFDVSIEDLKLDPKLWERVDVTGGHIPGEVYTNHKTGVTYEVMNGRIAEIIYRVSKDTCKMLSERRSPH